MLILKKTKLAFANVDDLLLLCRQTDPHSRPADLQGSFLIEHGRRSSQHAPSLSMMACAVLRLYPCYLVFVAIVMPRL
jgi:hypothetical protein